MVGGRDFASSTFVRIAAGCKKVLARASERLMARSVVGILFSQEVCAQAWSIAQLRFLLRGFSATSGWSGALPETVVVVPKLAINVVH